jgi:hypothetical protein
MMLGWGGFFDFEFRISNFGFAARPPPRCNGGGRLFDFGFRISNFEFATHPPFQGLGLEA